MLIWMVYTKKDYEKNKIYYQLHRDKGKKLGMDINLIFVEYLDFGIKNNTHYIKYKNQDIDIPKAVIMRSRFSLLSRQFEYMGVDVFNNSYVCDICNDKAKTYQLVGQLGIDIIPSRYILKEYLNQITNDYIYTHNEKNKANNDYIIKTVDGHGGNEVYKYNDYKKNNVSYKKTNMVIQPLIDNCNKDIRVYVLNNKIIAAVERSNKSDFRSNFSLGGNVTEYILKEKEIDIVNKIIELFKEKTKNYNVEGLFYVGIDFLVTSDGRFLFNEIEDVVGSRMLYQTSEIDIIALYINEVYRYIQDKEDDYNK